MDLMHAIKNRRSIRRLKAEPVNNDLVDTVLEAGRWAPSWANTQCWRFVVVRDALMRGKVAETISPGNPATDAIRNAPVTIVVCGELGRSGYKKGAPTTDKGDWYMFDTALATQNMMLTAYSLGLGTVAIGSFDASKVAELLGVPSNVRVVLLLPLGYPVEEPTPPRRKELSEIVSYDRY
ncbi:MAG: Albonoursin synthase [Chloroflexi bacterium]|nr:Albonoursin synthase [Chloroflexota bacterium]MBT9163337.1 Albonoursin synthase [Chloroflexota bacterium]MBT9165441.1 Albonoursin synthase [Chloroflexota bacterium]